MKTLIFFSQPSLSPSSSSPWKPKTLTFHPRTLQNQSHPKRSFGSVQPATTKETPTSKNSGKNDNNDGDEEVPQVVFERMLVRIIAAVGLPLATGFAFLKFFDAVKENHLWDVPLWLPFFTTLLTFGTSALGIAYGALSTSWDAEKKGSVLGLEEAQSNWVEMWREEDESNNSKK
ncbi:unnamed protein product [Malus baccata var. baccata]